MSQKIFIHAYNSFEDFNKNIIAMYEAKESEKITRLTIILVVLTGIMVLIAIFRI